MRNVCSRVLLSMLAACIGMSAPCDVLAQPAGEARPSASTEADLERAREAFREGVALMAAEDFVGALAKFKATARVKMSAQVAFNIAECEERIGRLVSALGNYRLALAKASEGGADKVLSVAPERIAALEPKLAKLTIRRVEERPNPKATLELDGSEMASGQLGVAMPSDPGQRVVRVLVDGAVVSSEKVVLREGEVRELKIRIPAPASPSPAQNVEPPVEAKPPEEPAVDEVREPSSSTSRRTPLVIGLLAGGGASLVAGAVFLGLRQGAIGELDDACSADGVCPESMRSTYDSGRTYTGLAEVFVPLGVAAAAAGLVVHLTDDGSSGETSTATVSLRPGARGADGPGLSVVWTY